MLWDASPSYGGALADAAALYGTITFSGSGTYSITGTLVELSQEELSTESLSGTYAIGSSGFGYITDPLLGTSAQIRGMVSNGVFIGSVTESTNGGYNELFIAAQIPSPTPGLSSLSGSYAMSYVNYSDVGDEESPLYFEGAQFTMNPNGAGSLGSTSMRGYYVGNGSSVTGQVSNVTYTASNGAMILSFPTGSSATLISGQQYLYQSPDGNFVFGGSPCLSNANSGCQADMMIGVKTTGSGALLSNYLYYLAGVYSDASELDAGTSDSLGLNTYYGSFNNTSGNYIEHLRDFEPVLFGGTYSDVFTGTVPTTSGTTYSDQYESYSISGNGNYRIGFGNPPYLGLDVAMAAPTFSGSGVYLNPVGVVNAASYAPFTEGLSPGELLILTGTNLASNTSVGSGDIATSSTFPTVLGNNVEVLIDGIQAPLYYVSATQIAAIVPYAANQFSFATVQVSNNGTLSNKISEFVYLTTPGALTYPIPNGISDAAATLYDPNGNYLGIVTESNPAEAGDTIAIFCTGLGTVFPPITDGNPGSSNSPNYTVQTIGAYIGATAGTVTYAGLAPGLTGLYQINITVPTGLTSGDNYLNIEGPDSSVTEATIPIGSGAAISPARPEEQNGQNYKNSDHRSRRPLQKPVVSQSAQSK